MKNRITRYLRIVQSACVDMMANDLGFDASELQNILHEMDDDGTVLMSQGWYRLSEAAKHRMHK